MTRTLLIAPHADDETLFAAYLAQRHAAHVHVVYDEGREEELSQATMWLGCSYSQGNVPKGSSAEVVEAALIGLRDPSGADDWDLVILPAAHRKGHEEHNLVAALGYSTFRDVKQIAYLTYAPRGVRDTGGGTNHLSHPDQPDHIARKLAAMSCYRSQIEHPDTRPWFYDLLDMREYVA